MKRRSLKLALIAAAACGSALSSAAIFTFTPSDKDVDDLDHYYYYTWGFNVDIPDNHVIVEATLKFDDIWNWKKEPNVLYTHMLDDPSLGIKKYFDNMGGGNAFSGDGVKVGQWSDPVGGKDRKFDLVYNFSQLGLLDELNSYIQDGRIGFGFDPDCHFYNKGITFTIKTAEAAIPGPAALLPALLGAASMRMRMRRK